MKNGSWPKDSIKRPNKQMRSVWGISTPPLSEKKLGKHPTQKPMELMKRVVLSSTNEGELILDPFTGSSTTGLAAFMYDREFIGIDNNQEYLDLSIRRFQDLMKDVKKSKEIEKSRTIEDYN